MVMKTIISSLQRYVGNYHLWAKDQPVVVVAVHREDRILESDAAIGSLRPGDVIEFAPFVPDEQGGKRPSFVTSDARPDELVPVGRRWRGALRYDVVTSMTRAGRG
jgi:hypothetical protein